MRPHLFGPRAVAPQLLELGVPTTLISDNMMGALFAQGEIKKLCLFYGELNDGSATGPVGSLLAAQLARLHGVAIELMVGEPSPPITLDRDVGTFMGKPICPAGVIVRPLAPDSVPLAILKT
jgi:methylthioribose-1-phosphate isomerase